MKLTEEQKLALELLAEEAAEVIHIKSKIIRFGLDDVHGDLGTNKERLEMEMGHVLAGVSQLCSMGVADLKNVLKQHSKKRIEWRESVSKC